MKIKSYEFGDIKIILTKNESDFVIERFENDKRTNYNNFHDYEFADSVFDFYSDLEFKNELVQYYLQRGNIK